MRPLLLTIFSAVNVVEVFNGPFVKAELREFGANSVDSLVLKETTLFTGKLLLMFPVKAMTLGAILLERLLCRKVNYVLACLTLARILLTTRSVPRLLYSPWVVPIQLVLSGTILVLFRTSLTTMVVIGFPLHPFRLALVKVLRKVLMPLVLMNLTPGISGLNPLWTVGPYAVDSVFTAWLRKLRATETTCVGPLLTLGNVFGRACLQSPVSPSVVLPFLVLEPLKQMWEFLGVFVSPMSPVVSPTRGLAVKQPSIRVVPVVRLSMVPIYPGRVHLSVPMVTFVRKLRHLPLLIL